MTDEKLLKAIKYFNAESECRGRDPWKLFFLKRIKAPAISDSRTRTNIMLMALSNDELNDLVTIVKVGKYDELRTKDAAWTRAKHQYSFGNVSGWKNYLREKRLSNDECIAYLRKYDAGTIVNDIYSYLKFEPMTSRQRAIIRKANMLRINEVRKHDNIETR